MSNPHPTPEHGPSPDQATDRPSILRRYAAPAALVVGGVTVGSFFAPIGFASAQDDGDDPSDRSAQTDNDDDDGDGDWGQGKGRHGHGGHGHGHGLRGLGFDVLTETLGLDGDELRSALAEGSSLADIAAEQGVAVEDLQAALVAAAEERIDDAVAAGTLDAERAEDMKVDLAERIEDQINRVPGERAEDAFGPGKGRRGPGGLFGDRAEMGTELADFLGLSTDELRAAFADGQSLAEVAAGQDVSEEALVDFLLGRLEERLDQAVEDEKIDAEAAEQMLERAEERIQDHIDDVPGAQQHRGRPGDGRHGGLRGFGHDDSDGETSDTGVTNNTSFQA